MYRRRRLGALLAVTIATCSLYAGVGAEAGPRPDFYTVTPGDTLWEVATEHYSPSQDPRVVIEAIREENGLEGYRIRPGMRLELPR